ncbi:trypsin-like peptidase domain-containing protein [Candidatus Dependentiae bacterium]|nr:trypsin-like peptidase domain-containing protein [Candidatus Dependentiae bacterium]
MSRNQGRLSIFQLFFGLVMLGGVGFGGYFLYQRDKVVQYQLYQLSKTIDIEKKSVTVAPTIIRANGASVTTWIDVQRQVKNTVVKIICDVAAFHWLEPYNPPMVSSGSGSGFFINSDGDIVTNWHVVNQAQLVQIEIPALGAERLTVEVAGISPERDVALLRLTQYAKERIAKVLGDIPFLKFGNSDEVRREQDVLALGYPLGVQALKSTQGIVSGRERISLIKQSCIQTTAPLNPGNSGGPAINSAGQVVGINFAGMGKAQNVGYIIPINDVKSAIKDLHKIRLLRRPLLGCSLEPANEDMIEFLGNPKPGGFYIAKVFKNMMLEKFGVQAGDMIYEVNGYQVDRFGRAAVPWNEDKVSMLEILDRLEVGDKIYMVIYRNGERKEIEFMLEPRFLQPVRFIYPDFEEIDYETIAGIVVMELAQNHLPILAEQAHALLAYESPEKQYEPALVVSSVQPTSLANKLRLLYPGMIISEVNGEPVKTLEEFRVAVRKSKKTRFLTIRTQEHWFVVFSVDNIVLDEDRLSKIYQFEKSKLIDEIA